MHVGFVFVVLRFPFSIEEHTIIFSSHSFLYNSKNTKILAVIDNVFLVSPSSQTLTEGDTLGLFCVQGGSLPQASVQWTLNGVVLVSSSRVTVQFSVLYGTSPQQVSSSLFVEPAQKNDSGVYRCVATNPLLPASPVTSDGADITVQGRVHRYHEGSCKACVCICVQLLYTNEVSLMQIGSLKDGVPFSKRHFTTLIFLSCFTPQVSRKHPT